MEAHNITNNNSIFFENNKVDKIIALTATPPRDPEKLEIFKKLNIKTVFELSLDEGIKRGVVSPYEIEIIELPLDNIDKYIKAGNKAKPFYQTEFSRYRYLSESIRKLMYANSPSLKFLLLQRMRFIYNLKSKTNVAKALLDTLPKDERILIFCGSIPQAEELCKYTHHSKNAKKDNLSKFCNGTIDRLAAVQMLNEGINIPNVDTAVIVQLNSNDLHLIQRIGRVVRFRNDHIAKIYIISAIQTQDEVWVEKALESFDASKIKYTSYKTYMK